MLPHQFSILLGLPRELRGAIYEYLFTSISLAFFAPPCPTLDVNIESSPNPLSLLRVCHQIHDEIGSLWLNNISFEFQCLEILLDTLSKLPDHILSQIRHVLLAGTSFLFLSCTNGWSGRIFTLAWTMRLLPALNLDVLTVVGVSCGEDAYETLDGLVKHGTGWRELRYITASSSLLGFASEMHLEEQNKRKPQPNSWNWDLGEREGNGENNRCSVKIYRSIQTDGGVAAVLGAATRTVFEQCPGPEEIETFGYNADMRLMSEDEKGKGLLVIVRRAWRRGPDFVNTDVFYPPRDIESWPFRMTWRDVQAGRNIEFI